MNDESIRPDALGPNPPSPIATDPTQPTKDVFAQQLKNRKHSRVRHVFGILGLMTLAGGVVGAGYLNLTQNGRDLKQTFGDGIGTAIRVRQNPDMVFDHAGSDHVNILLIGRDVDYKEIFKNGRNLWHAPDKNTRARSDSMIVMALDKSQHTVRMVSFPRDAMVHLPPNDFHVRRAKLNAAHAYGGPKLLEQTIRDELGVTIHHYAVIKFDGFKKLIDDVGGVWVNVDGALKRKNGKLYRGNLDYDDNWGNLHIHLKPGLQLLDGEGAHNYVRFRMDLEGDPGRIRRQQAVMRALAKQMMHLPPWKLPPLIKEIRRQFETDMTDDEIGSAAYFAQGLGDAGKIQPLTLFGVYSTRGQLTLNRPKNKKLLAYVFGPTFTPQNFLQRSPSTDEDELGPTNDSSPAAHQVLVDAGIIKGEKSAAARSAELEAPVKPEATSRSLANPDEPAPSEATSSEATRYERDTRLAVADPSTESRPRHRRHSRHHTDEASQPRRSRRSRESSDETRSSTSGDDLARHSSGSTIPVPERESTGISSSSSSGSGDSGAQALSVESGAR